MTRLILEGKHSGETRTIKADFISDLAAGETISSASVTCTLYSGTDASPSSLISGSASISGSEVSQKITGGTEGNVYKLSFSAVTSTSQTLKRLGFFAIIPDSE